MPRRLYSKHHNKATCHKEYQFTIVPNYHLSGCGGGLVSWLLGYVSGGLWSMAEARGGGGRSVGQPWSPLQKAGRAGAARPAKMEEGEKECKVESYEREVGLWSGAGCVSSSQPHTLPFSLTRTCVNSWYIIQIHCNCNGTFL